MKYKELSLEETIKDIKSSPQYCWDENYIFWTAKTTPTRGKRAVELLLENFDRKDKILDVGYSQGLTIGYTGQAFPKLQGIDIDPAGQKTAKERLKKLGLKTILELYDGKNLPYKDNSFDGVISTEVFEHVENRDIFVKELYRVLKPGGKLIISTPNKLFPIECEFHLPFLSYFPKPLADVYVRLSGKGKSYDGVNHPTYSQFKKALSKYFKIKDITFDMIKNYKKYYLDEERGGIVAFASRFISFNESIKKTPFSSMARATEFLLKNMSAGWFFVCEKQKNSIY